MDGYERNMLVHQRLFVELAKYNPMIKNKRHSLRSKAKSLFPLSQKLAVDNMLSSMAHL